MANAPECRAPLVGQDPTRPTPHKYTLLQAPICYLWLPCSFERHPDISTLGACFKWLDLNTPARAEVKLVAVLWGWECTYAGRSGDEVDLYDVCPAVPLHTGQLLPLPPIRHLTRQPFSSFQVRRQGQGYQHDFWHCLSFLMTERRCYLGPPDSKVEASNYLDRFSFHKGREDGKMPVGWINTCGTLIRTPNSDWISSSAAFLECWRSH